LVCGILDDQSENNLGRIVVWNIKGIYETDQYDTKAKYRIGAKLYCGADGKLTSKKNYNMVA